MIGAAFVTESATSTPAFTMVLPVYVFSPLSVSVPAPAPTFVSDALPEMTPLSVNEFAPVTPMLAFDARMMLFAVLDVTA